MRRIGSTFDARQQNGFTLIELLVVVVIIGVLAAIAIPKFANTKEKAHMAAMKSDLRNLVIVGESRPPSKRKIANSLAGHRSKLSIK